MQSRSPVERWLVRFRGRPRRGDTVPTVAISGHRALVGPRQPGAFAAGPVVPPAPPPDLFPGQPRVLLAQPADHPPPQVVAQVGEAAAARGVAVVVGPSAQDGVEHVDQSVEREVERAAVCQRLDAVHDRTQRWPAGEREGDALIGPPGCRLTRKPSTSKPSSTWVTAVFSGESVNCMCSRMNPAVCSLIAWAWASVPRTSTTKSSA